MCTLDHNPFGGHKVFSAPGLWTAHGGKLQAAKKQFQTIAEQLHDASTATADIIANYQKVDQSNAEIEKIFTANGATPAPGAPGEGY